MVQSHRINLLFLCWLASLAFVGAYPAYGKPTTAWQGEAAIQQLKREGSYDRLLAAWRTARHAAAPAEAAQADALTYTQLFKRTARDGAANDFYGSAVAADAETVVIGAYTDTIGNNARQGSAYVFARSGNDWTLQQKLTANDGEADERFGGAAAISGDTLVIGAPLDKTPVNAAQGSVYVFVRVNGVWTFQRKLTAPDGAAGDQFGSAVALNGATLVAGAFAANLNGKDNQGAAYVFTRTNGVWSFQQKLTGNDGAANDQFGAAVAVSGNTLIAGALLDDIDDVADAGSAYVFVRSGNVWSQQQKLTSIHRARLAPQDLFGASVALNGDTAVVGAPFFNVSNRNDQGMAVVYVRAGNVWTTQALLTASDGAVDDQFGISVALNGETVLVGAQGDDFTAPTGAVAQDQGSAYLFTRAGATWTQRQKFTALDGAAQERLGQTVALHGDRAVAGAPHAKVGANLTQGAVYLYGCAYGKPQTFGGHEREPDSYFGWAMAMEGSYTVIGDPGDTVSGSRARGSAYVFVRNGAVWDFVQRLYAPDGAFGDRFGHSVALSGNTIVVGAPFKSFPDSPHAGTAYIFIRTLNGEWKHTNYFATSPFNNQQVGYSVAIHNDLLAIGIPGGVSEAGYVVVYRRVGADWRKDDVLLASDYTSKDRFGAAVALYGNRIIVGAPSPQGGERSKGAAYVFERTANQGLTWAQRAKLVANDAQPLDLFGESVALYGDTALIGARGRRTREALSLKAAYVFIASNNGTWSQQDKLIVGEGYVGSPVSVALFGDVAVVGSSGEYINNRQSQGAAYVFRRSGAVWQLQQQLVNHEGEAESHYGYGVAVGSAGLLIGAIDGGVRYEQGVVQAFSFNCGPPSTQFTRLACVSAASYAADEPLASESIVAAFGNELASTTAVATTQPLPTELADVRVSVRDSLGAERFAPLFFVSPSQINFQIPPGTATGAAQVTVLRNGAGVASGAPTISMVAPALFAANANGQGVPAAVALRIKANGAQSYEPIARFDGTRFVPLPLDLGPAGERVFLVLYGTGLRYKQTASASVGGMNADVLYAGAAAGFIGLDQINLAVPRALLGRGETDLVLRVDGGNSNTLRVNVK
jgi:uncharacterized protein (TIGR03437 family)